MKSLTLLRPFSAQKRSFRCLLAAIAILSLQTLTLQAQTLINVDLNDAGNTFGTYTGTGVFAGGTLWNGVSGSGSVNVALRDASNNATSVSITTSGNTFSDGRPSTNALLADYAFPDPMFAPAVFTLSGLTPSGSYDFVLYGAYPGNLGFATAFTLVGATSTSITLTLDGQNENFVNGTSGSPGTYVVLNNVVASATGVITINFQGAPGSTDDIGIMSGFQLQAVPEPSVTVLVGAGVLMVALRRKKIAA